MTSAVIIPAYETLRDEATRLLDGADDTPDAQLAAYVDANWAMMRVDHSAGPRCDYQSREALRALILVFRNGVRHRLNELAARR